MYIRNGKVIVGKEDNDCVLRRRVPEILKTRLNLELEDLPEILEKMGVTEKGKEYEVVFIDEDYRRLKISVIGSGSETIVEFWRGSREFSEPFVKVKKIGIERIFSIHRKILVNLNVF